MLLCKETDGNYYIPSKATWTLRFKLCVVSIALAVAADDGGLLPLILQILQVVPYGFLPSRNHDHEDFHRMLARSSLLLVADTRKESDLR